MPTAIFDLMRTFVAFYQLSLVSQQLNSFPVVVVLVAVSLVLVLVLFLVALARPLVMLIEAIVKRDLY